MIEELPQILKAAVAGDQVASKKLLDLLSAQQLTVIEYEQIHIYLKASAQKYHQAIYLRGLLHEHGYGVKQDLDMSFILHREAAAKGNSFSTYEVGRHYLEGIGVDQHYENALQWLKVAAGSPHYVASAMFDLGRIYESGFGVDADLTLAVFWYEKAAKKGHVGAQQKLAK